MQLSFACPACASQRRIAVTPDLMEIDCPCGWHRAVPARDAASSPPNDTASSPAPTDCLVCGCDDLWRQKDFPQGLGLAIVGLGMLLSTIAWAFYWPVTAIGILMAFALADLVLYARMSDVLVCYRCKARHRHGAIDAAHPVFDLETAERYRQERMRLEKSL